MSDISLKSKIFQRESALNKKIFNISEASQALAEEVESLLAQAQGNVEAQARIIGSRQLLDECFLHKDFERNLKAIDLLFTDNQTNQTVAKNYVKVRLNLPQEGMCFELKENFIYLK